MVLAITGSNQSGFDLGDCRGKTEFDLVLPMQPSGYRAHSTGRIDTAFGVAPETTSESIGVGSTSATECFATIKQLQVLGTLCLLVLSNILA